jgi:hypothetical protein
MLPRAGKVARDWNGAPFQQEEGYRRQPTGSLMGSLEVRCLRLAGLIVLCPAMTAGRTPR